MSLKGIAFRINLIAHTLFGGVGDRFGHKGGMVDGSGGSMWLSSTSTRGAVGSSGA
jgi:hypothetical protein